MIYPQLFEYALIVGLCPKTDDPGYEPYIIHKFPQTVSEFFYVQFFCNDFKFHALWFVNGVFFSILKVLAKLTFFLAYGQHGIQASSSFFWGKDHCRIVCMSSLLWQINV